MPGSASGSLLITPPTSNVAIFTWAVALSYVLPNFPSKPFRVRETSFESSNKHKIIISNINIKSNISFLLLNVQKTKCV